MHARRKRLHAIFIAMLPSSLLVLASFFPVHALQILATRAERNCTQHSQQCSRVACSCSRVFFQCTHYKLYLLINGYIVYLEIFEVIYSCCFHGIACNQPNVATYVRSFDLRISDCVDLCIAIRSEIQSCQVMLKL